MIDYFVNLKYLFYPYMATYIKERWVENISVIDEGNVRSLRIYIICQGQSWP